MRCSRITLALGGGGARGVAHLGVIEALLEVGFEIERLVGVSIGSLAGAVFVFEPDIHRAQQRIVEYLRSPGFELYQTRMVSSQTPADNQATTERRAWYRRLKIFLRAHYVCQYAVLHRSILPGNVLRHAVNHLLPDADITEARVPLSIVTVDLLAGERVILEQGRIRDAVRASSPIPGVFPPVEVDRKLLCDMGVLNSLPTLATRNYQSGCVVAVDVSSALEPLNTCETAVDVLVRMNDIGETLFRAHVSDVADVVIRPNVGDVPWFDFSSPEELIELGRTAARQTIASIEATCCSART